MLTSMRKRVLAGVAASLLLGFAGGVNFSTITTISNGSPGNLTPTAAQLTQELLMATTAARTPQEAQEATNKTTVAMQLALVRQNDEIIRLLKKIAGER
jgi:hypothetical protein